MNARRHNPGFTLIEMLVALAMIATIVSMVYGSYAATSRSMEIYDSRLTCAQRTQLVLRLMERQLRCAYQRPADPEATEPREASGRRAQAMQELPQAGEIRIQTPRPTFVGGVRKAGGEVLDFITTAGVAGGPSGPQGLARIRYRHDPILGTLAIRCEPHLDTMRQDDSTGPWQTVLQHVSEVDIEFFDGLQWRPQWSGQTSRTLPRAVRLSLTVADEKGRTHRYGATVAIASRTAERKIVRETR
ncbi:type II secretion system protein GspJ [Anaerobaca lacustris]|uniref:Type II secretion system protein J n=1 Tax=Anaerobaca lacustris TaxID=3044600 RepID=A0AAW6U243_9BACT|nr:type II secretion system protein GspJ [Sedimentisphaerales bacterium M17dextr]